MDTELKHFNALGAFSILDPSSIQDILTGPRVQAPPVKDPLALTVMHCALFILIRPVMGLDLSREITASHLEEEMNTEFEMSVVSNFLVSTSSPVRYQKPVKGYCGLCFGSLNPPSCSTRRGHFLRLQKSHLRRIPLNVRAISAKNIYQKTAHSTVTFSMLFETSHSSSLAQVTPR